MELVYDLQPTLMDAINLLLLNIPNIRPNSLLNLKDGGKIVITYQDESTLELYPFQSGEWIILAAKLVEEERELIGDVTRELLEDLTIKQTESPVQGISIELFPDGPTYIYWNINVTEEIVLDIIE